jgi:hypothetical protein
MEYMNIMVSLVAALLGLVCWFLKDVFRRFTNVESEIKRFRESVIRLEEHVRHCPHYGGSIENL